MSNPTTIAVVHASVGSGHRIAAESVAAQLRLLPPQARVEVLDVLDFGAVRISGNAATGAFTGPTAPLYNTLWGNELFGRATMAAARPPLALVYRRFSTWLADNNVSAIVATHALAANLAVQATRAGSLAGVPVVAVATDFGLHGFWPRRGLSRFCVADDMEAETLVGRGTPDAHIVVTGIPVRAQFTVAVDRAAARERFDLGRNHRIVLALAGATQRGPYAKFKASLAVSLPAAASLPDTTVAVVTGRDETFADELRTRVAGFGTTNVRVLGYVEDIAGIMAAADLGVCKPGGLVTAECIAVGLPMVLMGPVVGQERANVRSLTVAGAAVFEEDPRRLAEIVRKTLARPEALSRMREKSLALARPGAARDVARVVVGLLAEGAKREAR